MNDEKYVRELAQRGAKVRLEEMRGEQAVIRRMFPDLFGGEKPVNKEVAPIGGTASSGPKSAQPKPRKRRRFTAAARKAISARMTKLWAARRKTKK